MREVAAAFQAAHGIPVEVVAGPTPIWAGRVAAEADLVFSGAEYMMDDFVAQFRDVVDPATRTTLFLRPSALLVRRGNPRRIMGLRDLLARVNRMRQPAWTVDYVGDLEAYSFTRGSFAARVVMPHRDRCEPFAVRIGSHELDEADARQLHNWLGVRLGQLDERREAVLAACRPPAKLDDPDDREGAGQREG
jgi:hypothetical protein